MRKRWLWRLGAVPLASLGLLAFLWATSPQGLFSQATCDRIRQEGMTRARVEALFGAQPFCVSETYDGGRSCLWGGEEEGGVLGAAFSRNGRAAFSWFVPRGPGLLGRLKAWLGW